MKLCPKMRHYGLNGATRKYTFYNVKYHFTLLMKTKSKIDWDEKFGKNLKR